MPNKLKNYFYYSPNEKKGILVLIFLILCSWGAYAYLKLSGFKTAKQESQINKLANQLDSIYQIQEAERISLSQKTYQGDKSANQNHIESFDFDPNQLTMEEWSRLGLSKKQSSVIRNYVKSGGVFKVKSDLKKIYSISKEMYNQLEPYILLPDTLSNSTSFSDDNTKEPNRSYYVTYKKVKLNQVDSLDLITLPGIGPFYSGQIVKYRNQLGGYVSSKQLLEIWNFDDSLLLKLDTLISIEDTTIRQININTASAEQLKDHPYFNWNLANSLVKLRAFHGEYNEMEDLKKSHLVSDSILKKIQPYIKFK